MESSEGPLPTPREMVDAFVHAPVLVPIGKRADGDRIVVLSHVELCTPLSGDAAIGITVP